MTDTAAERADRLERSLGDPLDPLNPVGFAAIAAADERREPVPGAAPLLAEFGLNAELVPTELGGRLRDVGGLIESCRRSPDEIQALRSRTWGCRWWAPSGCGPAVATSSGGPPPSCCCGGGRLTAAFGWGRAQAASFPGSTSARRRPAGTPRSP